MNPVHNDRPPHAAPGQILRICLLGPPLIETDDQPLTIPRRQVRSLLYYLAAHRAPISRERLCFLYWPDISENEARRNLSRLINFLRKSLPRSDILITSADQASLDPKNVWVDVHSFEADTDEGALVLYRGSFLEGFSLPTCPEYESWIRQEALYWDRHYRSALTRMIESHRERNNFESAISYAQRYLEHDELAEDIHRILIELYSVIGDRHAAMNQYEHCMTVLERELGVPPLPETQALFQAIYKGERIDSFPARSETSQPAANKLDIPLIGRAEALGNIEGTFQQVCSHRGHFLLVSGEPGIGKSRLIQEFISNVKSRAIILDGKTDPGIQNLPYRPIIEALRSIPLETYQTQKIQPLWLAETSRLLPDLRSLIPNLPEPLAIDEEGNPRLFEALTQILLGLTSEGQSVIICLEDLHWADSTTLEWLAYLSVKIPKESIFLLGSYRSDEAHKLSRLRQSLSRHALLVELPLTGLARSHVQQLLQHLNLPVQDNGDFVERLWRITAGNPFFLIEIIKGMLETTITQDSEQIPDNIIISGTVYAAVESRLEHLNPAALQMLQASAVLGASFDFLHVQQTSGRSDIETVETLDELVRLNLLVTDEDQYRFHHELIQTTVYQNMSSWRRQLLHKRAADWLEVEQPKSLNELAYHYERAGDRYTQKTITYLILAGDQARQLYGYDEAIDLYNRVLPLLKELGDREQIARIMMKIAQTHQNAFNFKQARHAYKQAFEVWRQAGELVEHKKYPPAPHPLRYAFADKRGVTYLDPPRAWEDGSISVIDQIFSGLVYINENMDVIPDTAKDWQVSEGGMEYIFTLREDVQWSDGKPLTAHDFEFAWRRALDPRMNAANIESLWDIKGGMAYHEGVISDAGSVGIRALDPYTLLVELEAPCSYFPMALNHNATYPVPRHIVEAHGEAWTDLNNIVTNGPFSLESRQEGSSLMLTRRSSHHDHGTGNVHQIKLIINQEFDSLMEMYSANQIDIISLNSASMAKQTKAKNQFPDEYKTFTMFGTFFIGFDVSQPPFNDALLRKAFAMAIDRQSLGKTMLGRGKIPAEGGFVPPGIPGHSTDIGYPFNIREARKLMAEAGFPDGWDVPDFEALLPDSLQAYGEFVQWQLNKNLGIDIQFRVGKWKSFNHRILYDPPHMLLSPWYGAYPDPDAYLRASPMKKFTRWQDEEFDHLIESATHSPAQENRLTCYQEADQILIREAVIIPILYGGTTLLVKPWVKSYSPSGYKWWFWNDMVIQPHD